jgi:hypothetical protein
MGKVPTLMCDGCQWKLGDDGALLFRDERFVVNDFQGWETADPSHALTLTIRNALMSITIVKELIETAATDRERARQEITRLRR